MSEAKPKRISATYESRALIDAADRNRAEKAEQLLERALTQLETAQSERAIAHEQLYELMRKPKKSRAFDGYGLAVLILLLLVASLAFVAWHRAYKVGIDLEIHAQQLDRRVGQVESDVQELQPTEDGQ